MVALDDDDPLWEQHSGGEGHRGIEWQMGMVRSRRRSTSRLPDHTRFVFDLLMDHPGERLTSDWIAAQLTAATGRWGSCGRAEVGVNQHEPDRPADAPGRVDGCRFTGGGTTATPATYAMKPAVARLFRDARQNIIGNHAELGSGDWSAAEITATVDDYLAMLKAELAGQPYSKAAHRRALLPRLNPVRTAAAVEFKHQNISAAMLDLGLPYIRGYKPMSNYQAALATEIQRHLEADPQLLRTLRDGTSAGTPPGSPLQRTAPPSPSPQRSRIPQDGPPYGTAPGLRGPGRGEQEARSARRRTGGRLRTHLAAPALPP